MVCFGLRLKNNDCSDSYFLRKMEQIRNISGYFKNPFSDYSSFYKDGVQVVKFDINRTDFTSWLLVGSVCCVIIGLEVSRFSWIIWVSLVFIALSLFTKLFRSNLFYFLMTRRGLRKSGYVGDIKMVSKGDLFLIMRGV